MSEHEASAIASGYLRAQERVGMLVAERNETDRWTCELARALGVPVDSTSGDVRGCYAELRREILYKVKTLVCLAKKTNL